LTCLIAYAIVEAVQLIRGFMANIEDVARLSGVSVGTVSNVLNNPDKVKLETRERVLEIIKDLNFYPNLSAQNLSRLKTDTIGLIFPFSKRKRIESYYTGLLAGITEVCFHMNMKLMVSSYPSDVTENEIVFNYRKIIESKAVDGLIVTVPKYNDCRIRLLNETGQKFAIFGRTDLTTDAPWVDIDGNYGVNEAVKYLANLGHTRIGYIGTASAFIFSKDRLEGYKQGLKRAGLSFNPELVMERTFDREEIETGEEYALKLLSLDSPPKAIIVSGSQLTLGAIHGINRFGYSVGEDISLICFDDDEWNVRFNPPITSIRQPLYEVGKIVAEVLIKKIRGIDCNDHTLLKPELIIRESCRKP